MKLVVKKKHIIISAVALVLVVALCLTAVFVFSRREDEYFITVNDEEITEEVYRAYLLRSITEAQELFGVLLDEYGGRIPFDAESLEEFWDSEIGGAPAVDWIRERAKEQLIRDTVIRQLMAENEITISEDEQERLSAYLEQLWERDSEFFEENEISREVFDTVNAGFINEDLLFNWFRENNETDAVVTSARTYFSRYFIINKLDVNGSALTEDEVNELRQTVQGYVEQINNGSDIDEIHIVHLNEIGVDTDDVRPLAVVAISTASEAYMLRFPNFVERLSNIEENTAFYAEDDNYFTVAIREVGGETQQSAFAESDEQAVWRTMLEEWLSEKIENAEIQINESRVYAIKVEEIEL